MLQIIAMIVGRYYSDSAEHTKGRAALLGPIVRQHEAIKAYRRAHRAVEDVNPATGELDPAPAPTPSQQ